MPLYSYSCPQCGNIDDHIRKFDQADDPSECSRCGATEKRIMFPGCGFDLSKITAPRECDL